MTAETFTSNPDKEVLRGNVRVEDKLRLRELELETQYELKFLTTKVNDLTTYVEGRLETETERFRDLNKRVTVITYLILAQLAGLDAPALIEIFKKALL